MPDFYIEMKWNGKIRNLKQFEPTEDYPFPWNNLAITNNKYGPLTDKNDQNIGIVIIRRAKTAESAIKEAKEAIKQAIGDYFEN